MKNDVLVLIILGLLTVSLFSSFALAASPGEEIRKFFTGWTEGEGLGDNINKIFLAIIIFLLITTSLEFVPSLSEKKAIVMIIAGIVAFLATSYISSGEVLAIVTSYATLGVVITSILPLLILGSFTYQAINKGDPILSILSQIAWVLFGVYSFYRFFLLGYTTGEGGSTSWSITTLGTPGFIIGATMVISAGVFLFHGSIRKKLKERIREEDLARTGDRARRAVAREEQLADATRS